MSDILQAAAPLVNMDATGGNFAGRYLDIARIVAGLVEEIKRLQEDNAAKDDYLAQRLMTLNMHHNNLKAAMEQVKKLDGELARWQEIAIDMRACLMYPFNMPTWDHLPENDVSERGSHLVQRGRAFWREQAAKELQIEAAKSASYITHLEADYLSWVREYYRDLGEDRAIAEAEAALAKIREGACPNSA